MFRIFQFVKKEQEFIHIPLPPSLRGRLVEIVIQEKAPEPGTELDENAEKQLEHQAEELRALDKLRNQLTGWDMR